MFKSDVDWESLPLGRVPDRVIAARVGCGISSVHNQRKRLGIGACYPALTDRELEKILDLKDAQMPYRQIAREMGCSESAVRQACKRLSAG